VKIGGHIVKIINLCNILKKFVQRSYLSNFISFFAQYFDPTYYDDEGSITYVIIDFTGGKKSIAG